MAERLTIVEILERSEQGRTRPFLCRCDDDQLYYVKGRGAGPRSLFCEWLGGHLAEAFGLPVPPFAVVQAPRELVDLYPEGSDLGSGPAFGSRRVAHTQEFATPYLRHVSVQLQRDVLMFDWWVRNEDRTLTPLSGNPNLLWNTTAHRLVVIDHNNAFDRDFNAVAFSQAHVFAGCIPSIFQDLVEHVSYAERFKQVLAVWSTACQNVPHEWWFADEERTVPADFDPDAALALLQRCTHEDFWKLTP